MKKLLILALLCLGLLSAAAASGEPAPPQTGSIVRTYSAGDCANQCWVCNGPVQLDSVTVTVDTSDARVDAVRLAPGCTGSIGRLDILTFSADGMKVAEGVHDLTIGGGTVYCRAKVPDPNVHQDGIQVMGGNAITFTGLTIDCGRGDEPKIDANLFISQGSNSTTPPTDVVCDRCWLGPAAAHTVNLNVSVRSGVKRSTVCPAKYAGLALTVAVAVLSQLQSVATSRRMWARRRWSDAALRQIR